MSKTTAALETAVAAVIANTPADGERQTNRQRVNADRAFAGILKLIAPRIRHFIRQYGLTMHWDDAEQCCAIGVHRAIQSYDPSRAQFTTFVNWQLRGELQALRFRLMTDQRPSAKKVTATTVSLHAVSLGSEGEEMTLEAMILDEDALERTESAAAAHLATAARTRLIDQYCQQLHDVGMEQLKRKARTRAIAGHGTDPAAPRLRATLYPVDAADVAQLESRIMAHREAIERRLGDDGDGDSADGGDLAARERARQVAKRATVAMIEMATRTPRFAAAMELPARPRSRRPRAAQMLSDGVAG